MDALGTDFTIATPAFPENKRTVFKGCLFVGDVLLNETGMQIWIPRAWPALTVARARPAATLK